jgi:hypothetical protein
MKKRRSIVKVSNNVTSSRMLYCKFISIGSDN